MSTTKFRVEHWPFFGKWTVPHSEAAQRYPHGSRMRYRNSLDIACQDAWEVLPETDFELEVSWERKTGWTRITIERHPKTGEFPTEVKAPGRRARKFSDIFPSVLEIVEAEAPLPGEYQRFWIKIHE